MVELLAPAGDLEKLKIALIYGADACFIGGREFSLRARASNFSIEEIKEACEFAHKLNKKIYVTTNIIPHEEDLSGLKEYLTELEKAKVDAILTASFAVLKTARENTSLTIHISTQQSSLNHLSVNFFKEEGARRIVLGRELSIKEIKEIKSKVDVELEVFIHGGMCTSVSGRCSLSNNMTNRDANRGTCAHSCRWNYDLYKGNDKINPDDEFFQISSKDLQTIKYITKLIESGVDSLKIEGRMKSLYYIATVVKSYRGLIDDYYNKKKINYSYYLKEIKKSENRLTSHGFLNGKITINEQLYNIRSEEPTKEFIGIVLAYDKKSKVATIEQRNYFKKGDSVEFFGPKMKNKKFLIKDIYDQEFNLIDVARHPKQIIKIKVPFELEDYAMLRLIK